MDSGHRGRPGQSAASLAARRVAHRRARTAVTTRPPRRWSELRRQFDVLFTIAGKVNNFKRVFIESLECTLKVLWNENKDLI